MITQADQYFHDKEGIVRCKWCMKPAMEGRPHRACYRALTYLEPRPVWFRLLDVGLSVGIVALLWLVLR